MSLCHSLRPNLEVFFHVFSDAEKVAPLKELMLNPNSGKATSLPFLRPSHNSSPCRTRMPPLSAPPMTTQVLVGRNIIFVEDE